MIPRSVSQRFDKDMPVPPPQDEHLIRSIEEAIANIDQETVGASPPRRLCLGAPVNPEAPRHQKSVETCRPVWQEFLQNRHSPPRDTQWTELRSVDFNNWQYKDADLLKFVRYMLLGPQCSPETTDHMNITRHCHISANTLDAWICLLYRFYNDVPFHNFKHAFMVAQMMYATIWTARLYDYFPPQDLFILLFSALCHDLDHPGFTNSYQVNVRSKLATIYNDHSPLENHHCSMAFILCRASPAVDILSSFTRDESLWIRRAVISCILSTDMSRHNSILTEFRQRLPDFFQAAQNTALPILTSDQVEIDAPESILGIQRLLGRNLELRLMLMNILLKVCDISNEIRDISISGPWLDCLLKEFFHQAEVERSSDLPVAPFMDPKLVTKSTSQIGFIRSSLIPLVEELGKLFPRLKVPLLHGAEKQLNYYLNLTNPCNTPNTSTNPRIVPVRLPPLDSDQGSNSNLTTDQETLDENVKASSLGHRLLAEFLLHSDREQNSAWITQSLMRQRNLSQTSGTPGELVGATSASSLIPLHENVATGSLPSQFNNNAPFPFFSSHKRPMRCSASDVPSSSSPNNRILRGLEASLGGQLEEYTALTTGDWTTETGQNQRRNSTSRLMMASCPNARLRKQQDYMEIILKHQAQTYTSLACGSQTQPIPTMRTQNTGTPTQRDPEEDRSRKSSTGSMVLAS